MTQEIYDRPDETGKDYLLQVRIKNGPLMRAMRMRGFKTFRALAAASGVHFAIIHGYTSLKRAPILKSGKWALSALKLAQTLRLPPDSLFPEQHLEQALARSTGEIEISRDEMLLLMAPNPEPTPEERVQASQMWERLQHALSSITAREERVLRLRFGMNGEEKSLDDVAAFLGVSRERVRQIEARAMRKLQHPSRKLHQFMPGRRPYAPRRIVHYHSDFELNHEDGGNG